MFLNEAVEKKFLAEKVAKRVRKTRIRNKDASTNWIKKVRLAERQGPVSRIYRTKGRKCSGDRGRRQKTESQKKAFSSQAQIPVWRGVRKKGPGSMSKKGKGQEISGRKEVRGKLIESIKGKSPTEKQGGGRRRTGKNSKRKTRSVLNKETKKT